ncbi:MAG: PD40 domain-containing protein [Prevotella sp.]|nr:PD40 domain-containing protein [Prevotella sp.]
MNVRFLFCGLMQLAATVSIAQTVDYSVVSVNEESGANFTRVTSDNDYVCMPKVKRSARGLDWLSNRILDVSVDGSRLAYLSDRGNTTNIFIKDIDRMGSSVQRTNRQNVLDFSYSPDGKKICFSEMVGKTTRLFITDASKGYMCRQITTNDADYTPVYSYDMGNIYFSRREKQGMSVWSYNMKDNFLSNVTGGMNPCPVKGERAIYCVRPSGNGRNEIWKVNYETGVEECVVADAEHSFTSPILSPNGRWLLFVGSSTINGGKFTYQNTDLFACRIDGSGFTQLTYHAADDLSPVWSRDGKYIYFVSQRGSSTGTANVWRMNFNLQ